MDRPTYARLGVIRLALDIKVVTEQRKRSKTHYAVMVQGEMSYYLCRGLDKFGKHPQIEASEVNCKLCSSIFKGRGLGLYEQGKVE